MNHQRLNNKRYPDPTRYEAFRAMEQEERSTKHGYRPIVYICSPYAGDIEANVERARLYSRVAADSGYIPLTVHLLYQQFMYDDDPTKRELALRFGNILMDKCSEVWVFGERISTGMRIEIDRARDKGYTIRFFSSDCEELRR